MIFVQDTDFTLHQGDCIEILRTLEPQSVHCCVTSPPYWRLRDYGTGQWEGGDLDCDHRHDTQHQKQGATSARAGRSNTEDQGNENFRDVCGKCGATRVDRQLGLEQTPDEYVSRMVDVFREVRRVLRDDGTLWLNMGDTYNSRLDGSHGGWNASGNGPQTVDYRGPTNSWQGQMRTLAPKNLVGIPWRLAFGLQADGWILRSDIIWAKPNPMPESVTDRPTKSHEYVFLLSKSPRYFFDQEAVREEAAWERWGDQTNGKHQGQQTGAGWIGSASKEELQRRATKTKKPDGWDTGPGGHGTIHRDGREKGADNYVEAKGRNVRSVWEIATQPYPDAHFATFPQELARRCIAAGTSERGCCPECGAPWIRQTDTEYVKSPVHGSGSVVGRHYETGANNYDGAGMPRLNKNVTTTGWAPACDHGLVPVPCVVLDPFLGSGTTAYVARSLSRRSIGIELNPDYCELAAARMDQQSLLAAIYDS